MTPVLQDWEVRKTRAVTWFKDLRDQICTAFEALEQELAPEASAGGHPPGTFEFTTWQRPNEGSCADGGGGTMGKMMGRVFEKVGVNVSVVHGEFSEAFARQIPETSAGDRRFWASGISLVAHMASPRVPAVHMNTRMLVTSKGWFGGGTDLTPMQPQAQNKADFHAALQACCDRHSVVDHAALRQKCDDYFYLPHRQEPRGDGGIFYDYLDSGDWEQDFAFTQDVGRTFVDIYPRLVRRTMNDPWTPQEREAQLHKRGRYVEFNLLHDRGTLFGLKTGGNIDAILMSLPPVAKWA